MEEARPANPATKMNGSVIAKRNTIQGRPAFSLFICQSTSFDHELNAPAITLWAGQIRGINITGTNHFPTAFRLLLLFRYTRKATNGIMVNAGIFVKMARPRNTPDSKIRT
jgi:hypothetical protein